VFDAAMLVGLWQLDREELLAGMLLFRVLYYIVPFILSLLILAAREVITGRRTVAQHAAPLPPEPPAATDVIAGSLDEAVHTQAVMREERRA
jgi:hypothetical protein